MTPELLLQHFNRISEAPDAIPRLRRFVLDLAVRGKLVEQDPGDEPASELLKRIEAEKERLVKEGRIKKVKPLPILEAKEFPFVPPLGWEWTRIRQVTSDRGQTVPKHDFTYIDVTAINKEVGCIGDAQVLMPADAPSRARKQVCTGDVVYSCVRPYLLNIAVVEADIEPPPIASTAFAILNGFGLVLPRYQWIVLRSPFMVECVEEKMRGQAYPAINDSDFAILPFPLPPLAEQHRIVAKVDELMALCDQLEAARNQREAHRDKLVAASLNRISTTPAEEATQAARFHLNLLPRLTTKPEHIKQLRQTILNLAVRGRLVEQDPNDEPAAELLKRIQAEKERLVKEGKIKKAKTYQKLSIDNVPFILPKAWQWVSIGSICEFENGDRSNNYPSGSDIKGSGVPFINTKNLIDCKVSFSNLDFITPEKFRSLRSGKLADKDILIVLRGSVGKIAIFEANDQISTGFINAQLLIMRNYLKDIAYYFLVYLKSETFQGLAFEKSSGSAQPQLSAGNLSLTAFPLPPLAEQHRIVAKVDQLMALCDQLEAQLASTEVDSRRLLEAVLRDALQPSAVAA